MKTAKSMKNLEKIAEKIYFDHPRLNSRSQLIKIVADEFAGAGMPHTAVLDKKKVYDMVIDRSNNPHIGEFLNVEHARKGKFVVQVKAVDDEWITGTIIAGEAKAIMDYNRKYEGEEIILRRCLCHFYPIKPAI